MPEAGQLGDGGFQGVVAQVGIVPAGDAGIGVAEQLGDGQQVYPHLGRGAGVGVAQFMEADLRFDPGLGAGGLEQADVVVLAPGMAVATRNT
jgi:hypothetical protein